MGQVSRRRRHLSTRERRIRREWRRAIPVWIAVFALAAPWVAMLIGEVLK